MMARHSANDTLHSIPRKLQLSNWFSGHTQKIHLSFQLIGFIGVFKQYTTFALSKPNDLYNILVELRTH